MASHITMELDMVNKEQYELLHDLSYSTGFVPLYTFNLGKGSGAHEGAEFLVRSDTPRGKGTFTQGYPSYMSGDCVKGSGSWGGRGQG